MINVVWLPPENQWDQYTFELLFNNKMWLPVGSYDFEHHKSFDDVPEDAEGIILVVPHKYYVDKVKWINDRIKGYKWLLYVGTGNEEAEFPIENIKHPNKIIYYTTPHLKRTNLKFVDRLFGDGYAPQSECVADYKKLAFTKPLDLYFGGQVTHIRREQMMKSLKHIASETSRKVDYLESEGFTRGYPDYHTYYEKLASAKIVPCPSGPNTPDTFRSYEALEALALPVLDTKTIYDELPDYWSKLFGEEPPFPIIKDDWESLPGYSEDILADWNKHINKAVSWWIAKKRQYAYDLAADLQKLTGKTRTGDSVADKITVIVLTSPIPSNPDTAKIDECIASIRQVLPEAEIIIGIDGIREEQEDRRPAYEEFTTRLLWNCLHEWENTLPIVFEEHLHQAIMTKRILEKVNTPTILFMEHDMIITSDNEKEWPPYEWDELVQIIEEGQANVIRFHFEAVIPEPHEHLMLGGRELVNNIPMIKTIQWSQRPHLASTAFYRELIDRYFTEDSRTFIEDAILGKPMQAYAENGITGWNLWRVWIYAPSEPNMKRCYTIDGREDDPKFEMRF